MVAAKRASTDDAYANRPLLSDMTGLSPIGWLEAKLVLRAYARDVADLLLRHDADARIVGGCDYRGLVEDQAALSASSARQVAPACFMVSMVRNPTTGTSKRMSWFGLATLMTVKRTG